jgi:hypothetical protein
VPWLGKREKDKGSGKEEDFTSKIGLVYISHLGREYIQKENRSKHIKRTFWSRRGW